MVKKWNELSVLIAGCGSAGKRHARCLHGLGVTDIRACDPNPAQRDSLRAQVPSVVLHESVEAGLAARPDTVLIATSENLHIPIATQAVNAGAHVLCEKPLADNSDGIDELEALAARQNRKVMVALCFRFHDGHRKAKGYLDSGRIGWLVSIRAMMGEHLPTVRPDYLAIWSASNSGAFECMHEIDLAIWYANQPVRKVHCLSGNYSDIGHKAPDITELLLDFEDRCMASIHIDKFQQPRRRVTELIGTKGVITVEFARWDHCTVSVYDTARGAWAHEELTTDRDDMFRAEDREFLEAVAEDRPIRCTIAEGRKSLEAIAEARSVIA